MQDRSSLAQYFVYSNVFISLCCTSQGLLTYTLLDLPINYFVVSFLFCSTFIVYNLYFLFSEGIGTPYFQSINRKNWVDSHKKYLYPFVGMAIIVCFYLLFNIATNSILFLAFLGILGILYSLPYKNGIKSVPSLKSIILIFMWTGAVVLFPLLELNISIWDNNSLILFFKRMVFIACLTIPFDIRDYENDKQNNINTIPVVIGILKTKLLCYFLLLLYFVLLFVFDYGRHSHFVLGLGFANALLAFFIYQSNQKKEDLFFWVKLDGIMILQFLLVYIFSKI